MTPRRQRELPTPKVEPQLARCRIDGCGGELDFVQDRLYGRVFERCSACARRVLEVKQLRDLIVRLRLAMEQRSRVRLCVKCNQREVGHRRRVCDRCAVTVKHAPRVGPRRCSKCRVVEVAFPKFLCDGCRVSPSVPDARTCACGAPLIRVGTRGRFPKVCDACDPRRAHKRRTLRDWLKRRRVA